MSDRYDNLALEQVGKQQFGLDFEVAQVIVWRAPVSRTDYATVFLTTKKQLYLYITPQSRLLLADVQKIVARMGLKAELYVPPKGRPHYFDDIGREKFREVFPGREHVTASDIAFYRTLAPYGPALVQLSEVKDGVIRQYDSDTAGGWRTATKFTYRRIKTS